MVVEYIVHEIMTLCTAQSECKCFCVVCKFKSVKEKVQDLHVCMRGLYSMQRGAINKAPWLDPRIGIYTSCSYRQGKSG